jgi:hypothetical protein
MVRYWTKQIQPSKYLGINIHKRLSWYSHIDKITKKANSTLAFLGRNVSHCPTTIKAQCYTTLVRPTLEYASSIWSPSKKDSINKVEAVQRRAAMFATGDYQRTSTVTAMLQHLKWQTLKSRRAYAQTVITWVSASIPITGTKFTRHLPIDVRDWFFSSLINLVVLIKL